jgi:hypothetical protein
MTYHTETKKWFGSTRKEKSKDMKSQPTRDPSGLTSTSVNFLSSVTIYADSFRGEGVRQTNNCRQVIN